MLPDTEPFLLYFPAQVRTRRGERKACVPQDDGQVNRSGGRRTRHRGGEHRRELRRPILRIRGRQVGVAQVTDREGKIAATIGGGAPHVGLPLAVGVAVLEQFHGAVGTGGAHDVDRAEGGGEDDGRGDVPVGTSRQVNAQVVGENAVLGDGVAAGAASVHRKLPGLLGTLNDIHQYRPATNDLSLLIAQHQVQLNDITRLGMSGNLDSQAGPYPASRL